MKIIFNPITKLFAVVTHYTNGEGAKGIMRTGYRDPNQNYGTSFFGIEDDYLRNSDVYKVAKLHDKFRGYRKPQMSLTNFGNVTKLNKSYKPVTDTWEQDIFKTPKKDGVHYPKEFNQFMHIRGVYGNLKNKKPIYRVLTETKNDDDIYTVTGFNEHRVPVSNIDNSRNKVEIPRGMYTGDKAIKRGYINDYNDFNPKDFNMEDAPTKEAVEDIKKKLVFLGKSHGKKRS